MSNQGLNNHEGFQGLNIKDSILVALKKMGLETPTPIQIKAIPVAISGQDLVGVAQTGTGKTFAFGIPMIQRLAEIKGRALVLLPTRELATQVNENLRRLGTPFGLKTISLIGGEAIGRQLSGLRQRPHVLVATPGRLLDHAKHKTINLADVSILILDEADMMFDLGFAPQIEDIIKQIPNTRQTMLFSATMPAAIIRLATKHLSSPVHIEVAPAGTTAELVDQEIYIVHREDRVNQLEKVLAEYKGSVLIFVRTKLGAGNLTKKLRAGGLQAAEIHSNLSFNQRRLALAGFRSGAHRILVATDVAARGLDINDIELVVNYDLPENSEDYVHRIGRTARAGKKGKAISFATPIQRREIKKIERLINKNIPLKELSSQFVPSKQVSSEKKFNDNDRFSRNSFSSPRLPKDAVPNRFAGPRKPFRGRDSQESTRRPLGKPLKKFGRQDSFPRQSENKFNAPKKSAAAPVDKFERYLDLGNLNIKRPERSAETRTFDAPKRRPIHSDSRKPQSSSHSSASSKFNHTADSKGSFSKFKTRKPQPKLDSPRKDSRGPRKFGRS